MQLKKVSLIEPSLYQEKICAIFAKEIARDRHEVYSAKGTSDLKKLEEYAYRGKMAEYAVFNTLLSYNNAYKFIMPPDISMYEVNKKSHAADLIADDKNVHVKSCFIYKETAYYKTQWMFSTEDLLCVRPAENDIVCFVKMTLPQKFEAYFVPAIKLLGMYREPHVKTMVGKCIYEEDLIK
jgi:hypothetical protein